MRRPIASFDVVIPAHDAAPTIVEQLDAVRRNDAPALAEVIVVDSFSSDDTAQIVTRYAERWPKVRLVAAERPGANAARNTGIIAGRSEAVLLCDADDRVEEGWAFALVSALHEADMVRGRYDIEHLNDPDTIAARGTLASTGPPATGEVVGGLGGNCGVRRRAWEELGGLAEDHVGSDDIELFWRAHLAGMVVRYADDAVVQYRLRHGYRALYRQQRAWSMNQALLYRQFRGTGLIQRRPRSDVLRRWAWLLIHVVDVGRSNAGARGRWTRVAGDAVGRIRGSWRHKVWFP